VSWRRSAQEPDTSDKIAGSMSRATMDVDTPSSAEMHVASIGMRAAPQSPQNLLPNGLSDSQAEQRKNIGAPQSRQTFLPSGLMLLQLGQSMSHPIQ